MSQPISLYKRGEIWWYRFTPPDGIRVRASSGTLDKKLALEIASKHYSESFRKNVFNEKANKSWIDAVVLWFNDKPERKEKIQYHLKWLDKYLSSKKLSEINRELILSIRDARANENVSVRSINAILQQIRGVLKCAYEHDWIDKVPPIKLLADKKIRVRYLTPLEESRLINELPEHLKFLVKFALNTGLRKSNIANLRWVQINLIDRMIYIDAAEVKTRESLGIPLNEVAYQAVLSQAGKHKEYVFTYKGKQIKDPASSAWEKSLIRAGIKNFTFHDLRHCWATKHISNGTSLYALQSLGGWNKADTVKKYAHLKNSDLKKYAEQIIGTNLAQSVPDLQEVRKFNPNLLN